MYIIRFVKFPLPVVVEVTILLETKLFSVMKNVYVRLDRFVVRDVFLRDL